MASTAHRPVLYSFWRSSCSWRVRAALAIKDIAYDYRAVDVLNQQNESDAYRRVNKGLKVPSLEIDGVMLNQSSAILEYLEETRPSPALLPPSAADRALVRSLCDMIGMDIQPLQNVAVLRKISEGVTSSDTVKAEWVRHWVTRGFEGVEARLTETAGQYCFGDSVTMADIYLAPQVLFSQLYNVDLTAFPTIRRINATLLDHPAFLDGHPNNMPDAPAQQQSP